MASLHLICRKTGLLYKRSSSSFAVVDLIQSSLVKIYDAGVPWWLVFGNCTLAFRLLLFPIVRRQIVESSLLKNALPEINVLTMLLKNKLKSPGTYTKHELTVSYINGVRAALILHDIYPSRIIAPIALNFSVFVTFIYSIRSFIIEGSLTNNAVHSSLEVGGLYWFQNLTMCDNTYILPCVSIGLSYFGIVYAFKSQEASPNQNKAAVTMLPGPVIFMKEAILTSLLLSLPIVASLPAGVFMYWIPNSCYSITQTYLLRNPTFRKLIRV